MRPTALIPLLLLCLPANAGAQESTWEPMNRGLRHLLVYTIEIDPLDSLVMYVGTDYGNLYKSVDGGFNLSLSNNGIPSTYNGEAVTALYVDRLDRNLLFAGFGGRKSAQNLFRSTDAGARWSVIGTPPEWSQKGVLVFYKSFGAGAKMFCGLGWSGGVWASSNSGTTWNRILADLGVQVISGHPSTPMKLYAGTASLGPLYRSVDGGIRWSQAITGILNRNDHTGVRAITVSTQDPNLVFIGVTGSGAGLYKSTNGGNTWMQLNGTGEISEIAVHPKNRDLIYISAIGTGVQRSTDGGATWKTLIDGLPTKDIMRVRIAQGYPVRVFAMTLRHGIYRLVDEELEESIMKYAGEQPKDR